MRLGACLLLAATLAVGSPAVRPGQDDRLNVVLLTVDSMRPDHLGAYGYSRPTSPHLDAFAEGAAVFPNAIAVSSWTFPGIFSMLSGVYPARHGLDARGRVFDDSLPTLPSLFHEAGYQVPDLALLTPIPGMRALQVDPRWQRARGETEQGGALLDWLRSSAARQAPFFAWYHYRGVHLPYRPQPQYETLFGRVPSSPGLDQLQEFGVIPAEMQSFSPEEQRYAVDLYDATVRYFDDLVGKLVDLLEATGLDDRTIVVITADHGEELFEHGLVGHASTTQYAHAYDEILRIPLVLKVPGESLSVPECQVSQVDVMPTVLALAGLAVPDEVTGRDLSATLRGAPCHNRPVFAESIEGGFQARDESAESFLWAVRTPEWKLIVRRHMDGDDERELYDLTNDPAEQSDLFAQEPAVAERLGSLLDDFYDTHGGADYWIKPIEEAPVPRRQASTPASAPQIIVPADDAVLRFQDSGTGISGEWTGSPTARYVIEYDVGEEHLRTTGTFTVIGTSFAYGPIPLELWETLVPFNPWRVRIWPAADPTKKSDWTTFSLDPAR